MTATAATIDEAIRRHAGEAAGVVEGYTKATDRDRETLLAFLKSL